MWQAALVCPVDSPVGEGGGVREVELGAEVGAVGVDGVHGKVQALGNLHGGEAVAD